MPSAWTFRLSTYATLILACACLGYAQWGTLPSASGVAGVVAILLMASFWREGGYELDLRTANRVGLALFAASSAWVAAPYFDKNSLLNTLPYPASLLPYLGPVLMLLMPFKMLRPKHAGDWWAMHGIALAAVCLAGALTEDAAFGVLVALYAFAAVWSVSILFLQSEAGALAAPPGADWGAPPQLVLQARPSGTALARTLGWAGVAGAAALALFLLTPGSDASPWGFGRARLEVGYSNEALVDLNRSGDLTPSAEVAFEVTATALGGAPKTDLGGERRWRGRAFGAYERGKWVPLNPVPTVIHRDWYAGRGALAPPLDAGPGAFELLYAPKEASSDSVLLDPVFWEAKSGFPVSALPGRPVMPWSQARDGSFESVTDPDPKRRPGYRQVSRDPDPAEADLGPAFRPAEVYPPPGSPGVPGGLFAAYRRVGGRTDAESLAPAVRATALRLLGSAGARDPAVAEALARAQGEPPQVRPDDFGRVARALAAEFAASGEFAYTLRLERIDRDSDPVEEFLTVTKAGHCQRFAGALALMLRGVGIPTQYVLGFKGSDAGEQEPGKYLVRQEHAHAWVEALVPADADPGPERLWRWLSLDPTPSVEAVAAAAPAPSWMQSAALSGRQFLAGVLAGGTPEQRAAAREWLLGVGINPLFPAAAGLVLAGIYAQSRRVRRTTAPAEARGASYFHALLRLAGTLGLSPRPGETPMAHAARFATELVARGLPAELAAVPVELTADFYRERYALEVPPEGRARRNLERLAELERAAGQG